MLLFTLLNDININLKHMIFVKIIKIIKNNGYMSFHFNELYKITYNYDLWI